MQNNSNPFISIIIPTYNLEAYISETLDSVLSQENFSNYEVLVVDDHSQDNTLNIVKEYQSRDARIKVLENNRTKGPAGTRNTALEIAKGTWITFLDGDDLWERNFLSSMLAACDTHPEKKFITCNFYYLFEDNSLALKNDISPTWAKYFNDANQQQKNLCLNQVVDIFLREDVLTRTGVIMIHGSLLKNIGLFDEDIMVGEDNLMWIKLAKQTESIVYVPLALMKYRIRSGSLTNNGIPLHSLNGEILLKRLLKTPDFNPHKKSIKVRLGRTLLQNCYYFRQEKHRFKAILIAFEACFFLPSSSACWKNLAACIMLR